MSEATATCPAVAAASETAARMEAAAAAATGAAGATEAKPRVKKTSTAGTATPNAGTTIPGAGSATRRKPKPKKGSKAAKRLFRIRVHRDLRWGVQILFFILSPALFSAAFNGVKYIFQQIGLGEAVEVNSFVVVMVALFGFTILFGRFFCGYACAFGTLGDAVYLLFTPVRRLLHIPDKPLPHKVQRALHFVKYGVLAAICALCFTAVWASISGYSPWTAFAGIVALSIDGIATEAFIVLGVIVLGMALVERFFCQFLCPLGAVFSLLPIMPFSAFTRDKNRCAKKCDRCLQNCPVGVHPDADEMYGIECIACGKCADGCPVSNINLVGVREHETRHGAFSFSRPFLVQVRGSEVWVTLAKAALLLAVCWVLGMLDYVPAFAEVFPDVVLPWAA